MAYNVKFRSPQRELKREQLIFRVKDNSGFSGRLKVSQGGVEWIKKGKGKGYLWKWKELEMRLSRRSKKRKRMRT